MVVFVSFQIESCCVAQGGLELVFFLFFLFSQDHKCAAPYLATLGILKLNKLTYSMASGGLQRESKHQAPLVIHPLALRPPPVEADLFLSEDSFAFSLAMRRLRIPSVLFSPFPVALAQPAQTPT